jgi:TonB family protein
MRLLDRPSVLRRGAAPPDERATALFLAVAAAVHVVLLSAFLIRAKPPREISLPAGGPLTRARLVRIAPLRSFPAPEAAPAADAAKARPKPALSKRYTPGAKVALKQERGPVRKNGQSEGKSSPREVVAAPQADLVPRWWSADSTRSTDLRADGDFRFAYYLAALRNKIGQRWVPPPGMGTRGRPVRAVLYFRIGRNGEVSLAQVESSSGYAFYDQTALRALLSATPLPPLPAGYTDSYLGVHFGFEFAQ